MIAPKTTIKTSSKRSKRPVSVVSKAMRAVGSENTTPELVLRKALWALGFRYRLHRKNLPGKPDLVFCSRRVALFIDGDYWHGRQWKTRGFESLQDQMSGISNSAYWVKKISGNVARDEKNNRLLGELGWVVIRVWESDIKKDKQRVVDRVIQKLQTA